MQVWKALPVSLFGSACMAALARHDACEPKGPSAMGQSQSRCGNRHQVWMPPLGTSPRSVALNES
jgi:hypothetical protein